MHPWAEVIPVKGFVVSRRNRWLFGVQRRRPLSHLEQLEQVSVLSNSYVAFVTGIYQVVLRLVGP